MTWQKERLFFEGDEYFDAVISEIRESRSSIFCESYIFNVDEIGSKVLEELGRAAARGVNVQLLIDGIGSLTHLDSIKAFCAAHDIRLRVYHPLPRFRLDRFFRGLAHLSEILSTLNKRDHRKIIMIDSRKAFLGSFNISKVHSRKLMGDAAWHDCGVLVEGPEVTTFARAFKMTWNDTSYYFSGLKFNKSVRLNSTAWSRHLLVRDLIKKFNGAQKEILITNAYFLPHRRIIQALRRAAVRGVTVGLCIPAKSDVWIVKLAAKIFYYVLLRARVQIYEYTRSVLHTKTTIVDNWAAVGSYNLNHRSLVHDLEAEAVLYHVDTLHRLRRRWEQDIATCTRVQLPDLAKFNLLDRFLIRFAYLFRYWI